MKLGHYAVEILSAVMTWAIITIWLPIPLFVVIVFGSILLGFAIVTFVGIRTHNRPPFCDLCLTPVDPDGDAEKHKRALSLIHLGRDVPSLVFMWVMALITITLMVVAKTNIFTILVWSIMQLTLIYSLRANVLHHRLQPWCPQCKQGGMGKDRLTTPNPDGVYA